MLPLEAPPVPRWVYGSWSGAPILMGMSTKSADLSAADLNRALAGDDVALGDLIDRATPIIHVRVARAILRRQRSSQQAQLRQEVEDLIQEVLTALFANDARVLRNWDPDKGLSLANYIGLVAERLTSSVLQSGKKTWPAELMATESLDRPANDRDPEQRAASRQELQQVLHSLRQELSTQGFEMFQLLFVEELSIAGIRQRTGMSDDAIYAWRSRLRKRARSLMRRDA